MRRRHVSASRSRIFFCKICAKDHEGHDDKCVQEVASEVQTKLTELKHLYLTKKTNMLDRLKAHQSKIEDFYQVFYKTLDNHRHRVLEREYELHAQMDRFEDQMKRLLTRTQSYTVSEFFFEKHNIAEEVQNMVDGIN